MSPDGRDPSPVLSADIFVRQRYGGIGRYFVELHEGLLRRGIPSTVLAPLYRSTFLRPGEGVVGRPVPERWDGPAAVRACGAIGVAAEWALAGSARATRRSVLLHRTYYSTRAAPVPGPTVLTVYDMIHETHPTLVSPQDRTADVKAASIRRADVIVTISHHTRTQLLERYPVDPDRVLVTHLGVSPAAAPARHVDGPGQPFVLYVGARNGYKNFSGLVEALSRCRVAGDGLGLVCFGGGPPKPRELAELRRRGLDGQVAFVGGDDAALASFLASARALVYPSRDEGFGLPPLEAMVQGCPVATSRAGAIPEIVGDAALLFDPTDVEEMAAGIDAVVSDEALRDRLRRAGRERAARFTWDATVDQTLAAYRLAAELD